MSFLASSSVCGRIYGFLEHCQLPIVLVCFCWCISFNNMQKKYSLYRVHFPGLYLTFWMALEKKSYMVLHGFSLWKLRSKSFQMTQNVLFSTKSLKSQFSCIALNAVFFIIFISLKYICNPFIAFSGCFVFSPRGHDTSMNYHSKHKHFLCHLLWCFSLILLCSPPIRLFHFLLVYIPFSYQQTTV